MKDGIPEVTDFGAREGTPMCPKCGTMMDRGNVELIGGQYLAFSPSISPGGGPAYIHSALSCIGCGYTELYTDPVELRCTLAGVKPPKAHKKPGLL